jgi:hypothetical protein
MHQSMNNHAGVETPNDNPKNRDDGELIAELPAIKGYQHPHKREGENPICAFAH